MGQHCPAPGLSPPTGHSVPQEPPPPPHWSELTNVMDEEVDGEVEVGGVREPLQVQLQRAQLLSERAEGGVHKAGVELAMAAGRWHPLPQGAVAVGGRQM